MLFRILASAILLFLILFLPFYVWVVWAVACMIYFSFFFESVFLFLIADALYGTKEARLFHISFIFLIISILLLIITEFLKRKLKSHF